MKSKDTILKIDNLKKHFPIAGGVLGREVARVYAVDGVTLELKKGTTLGLVGESGCGKSTLGRAILKLHEPTDGTITFEGKDITKFNRKEMRPLRRDLQIVFQDPFASLNPRMSIRQILSEPLEIHGLYKDKQERDKYLKDLMTEVGLRPEYIDRYPHEFSGGQRQRIGIARALTLSPKVIVCDEPVSALDVSVQSQVLNLLNDLQKKYNLSFIFIAHDLAVIEHISDEVVVMYLGKVVEHTTSDELYKNPRHPYTQALISSIPVPVVREKRKQAVLEGDVPSPINPPKGCHFNPRCPYATDKCRNEAPPLKNVGSKEVPHFVSCHRLDEIPEFEVPKH